MQEAQLVEVSNYISSSTARDEEEPERPWVVEVHAGRTARHALVLPEE